MSEDKEDQQLQELPRSISREPTPKKKILSRHTLNPEELLGKKKRKNLKPTRKDDLDNEEIDELDFMMNSNPLHNTPRHQELGLSEHLRKQIVISRKDFVKKTSMDYYDTVLYSLNARWHTHLKSKVISLECVRVIHHIMRLRREQHQMTDSESEEIKYALSLTLTIYPDAEKEYRICGDALELISALAVKYGFVNLDTFNYRHTDHCNMVKIIDLEVLNADIFTLEALWFCAMSDQPPIEAMCTNNVKQYAFVLREISDRLLSFLNGLNQHCDFSNVSSVFQAASARNSKSGSYNKVVPEFTAISVPHQTVKVKKGKFNWCCKSEETEIAQLLRSLVKDFANAYVSFERELIESLVIPMHEKQDPNNK